VEIVTLDDSETTPVVPEPPKKSPTEKRKKKWKKSAQPEFDGRLVIRLKKAGPTQPAEASEEEGRPGSMAKILEPRIVHSTEDGAVLATEVASVQIGELVLGTDEV
jgi:hypothetical protein